MNGWPVDAADATPGPSNHVLSIRDADVSSHFSETSPDYLSPRWGHGRSIASHAYGLHPGRPAVPLAYLAGGTVRGGVTVEIIEGEDTGRKRVSRDDNGSYMIEFLRLGAPFTVRASRAGYVPEVKTHPGIVDDVLGYPSNSTVYFTLSPLQ